MLKIKNITIGLILVLSIFCLVNHNCIASEGNVKLTYEQLTKQYPSMEDYIAQTRKNIKDNWYPPIKSFQNKATIVLTIKLLLYVLTKMTRKTKKISKLHRLPHYNGLMSGWRLVILY